MPNIQAVGSPLLATGSILSSTDTTAVLPTDGTSALPASFKALGYAGEDGVSQTTERGTEVIRAWGGDEVRRIQTDYGVSFSFTFLDTTRVVQEEVYGAQNVTASGTTGSEALSIKLNKSALPIKSYIFEIKDGDSKIRIVLPKAQITEVGDITYTHSDVIRYEVTVTAYPDASGNQGYIYVSGPAAV